MTHPSPRWSWRLLRCGLFWLDGGGMFGVVPKPLWSRLITPDDRNRIPVQTNALLLEREGALVVIEVGNGDKFGAKERDIYSMENRSVIDALHEAGARPEDVSTVIVSHLHFDHAGGLTRKPRQGEPERAALTFPNARIVTQRQEWEDAIANRSTMSRTYLPDHLTPEVRERLQMVDSPDPQVATAARTGAERGGAHTSPGAVPVFPCTEVLPGIEVFRVPGHTWGQQAVKFTDTRGRTIVFTPDVMPTAHHAGAAYNMGYDVEPYVSMRVRMAFLEEARREKWLLAIDHEPGPAVVAVEAGEKPGQYRLTPSDDHG